MSSIIYKILRPQEWQAAKTATFFTGAPVDKADGFIHFSTAKQVEETARRYFADCENVHVLAVAEDKLPADQVKWEPSRGGDLFPHLYGVMPMAAVIAHRRLEQADGIFDFSTIFRDIAP
ncbi:MAG: DUF952 domain-containing protein [Alphaproteobacteria bacterium]|nr:DUF952 domain-containing protein [Alphaproteobacteria bacterium]